MAAVPSLYRTRTKSLGERQADFVYHYVATCPGDASEAARLAGYVDPEAHSFQILNSPTVIKALGLAVMEQFAKDAPVARKVLFQLMVHSKVDSVRLNAACKLLDYAGLSPTLKQELTIKDERGEGERMVRIKELLKQLNMPDVIEVDAEDVDSQD